MFRSALQSRVVQIESIRLSLTCSKIYDFDVRRYFIDLRSSLEVTVVRSIRQRRVLPRTYIRLSFRTSQLRA